MLLKINSNLVFFWKDGHFICDDFVNHEQRSLNPIVYPVINLFANWKEDKEIFKLINTEENFDKDFLEEVLIQLKDSKILIDKDSSEYENENKLSIWNDWGTSCKYFHYSSRLLHNDQYIDKDSQYERLNEKKKIINPPNLYKKIKDSKTVKLPLPSYDKKEDFLNILLSRETVRSFSNKSISLSDLSTMLYLIYGAQSCKHEIGIDKLIFKTSPSGGCRHPIEVYPVILNVEGLSNGIYHYSVENHELEIISEEDPTHKIIDMAAQQEFVRGAGVLFFYTAYLERSMWKYQSPRAYRVLMMDAGHLSQTCFLVSNWLGYGCFFSGHLNDQYVEEELQINASEEIVLGVSGIGFKSKESLKYGRKLRFIKEMNEEI